MHLLKISVCFLLLVVSTLGSDAQARQNKRVLNPDKWIAEAAKEYNSLLGKHKDSLAFDKFESVFQNFQTDSVLKTPGVSAALISMARQYERVFPGHKNLPLMHSYTAKIFELRGFIEFGKNDWQGVVADFQAAIAEIPDNKENGRYHYIAGVAHNMLGEADAACKQMQMASELGYNSAYEFINQYCQHR